MNEQSGGSSTAWFNYGILTGKSPINEQLNIL